MLPSQPGIDEPGGAVDQQPEAPERALPVDAGDEVVGHGDPLERRAEHELARVEHEHAVGGDLDELGEAAHVLLDVDHPGGVVAEHAEQRVDPHIDRRRLDRRLVEWVDPDLPSGDRLAQIDVGQDHLAQAMA